MRINKTIIASSVAALMAVTSASVMADDLNYDIYGNIHLSVNDQDSDASSPELKSNTSAFGIKGNKKLGDSGIEVMFKLEWQVDPTSRNDTKAVVDRDQWIGFKGRFGKVLIGTASSNYKSKGGKVDPMYRTPLEGRSSFMRTQSNRLHGGAAIDRGRMTKSINYTTPKMNGFEVQVNTSLTGQDDSSGIGLRHSTKKSLVYVDYINDSFVGGAGTYEVATKVGGFYKFDDLTVGAQFENSADIDGSDYWFLSASYKLDKTSTLKFSTGEADGARMSSSVAAMYDYKLDKSTNIYAGYGSKSDDLGPDDSMFTIGARYKF